MVVDGYSHSRPWCPLTGKVHTCKPLILAELSGNKIEIPRAFQPVPWSPNWHTCLGYFEERKLTWLTEEQNRYLIQNYAEESALFFKYTDKQMLPLLYERP